MIKLELSPTTQVERNTKPSTFNMDSQVMSSLNSRYCHSNSRVSSFDVTYYFVFPAYTWSELRRSVAQNIQLAEYGFCRRTRPIRQTSAIWKKRHSDTWWQKLVSKSFRSVNALQNRLICDHPKGRDTLNATRSEA